MKRFKPLVDAKRYAFYFTVNFEPLKPVQDDRNSLLKIGAGNGLAQALMDAVTEAEMPPLGPQDIELTRVLPTLGIAIGALPRQEQ